MLGGHHIPHCLNDRTKIIRFIKIASIFHFLVQNHYLRVEKSETMNNLKILAATAVPQAAETEYVRHGRMVDDTDFHPVYYCGLYFL